jgi:hypothetical protein
VIHIRVDNEELNSRRKFACGLGPDLPEGDTYYFESEGSAERADCPGCNPHGSRPLGTPLSQISTQPGQPGYEEWLRISRSWGYE